MIITEYADSLNVSIIITYHYNQSCRWSAKLEGAEILIKGKEGFLHYLYGNGITPEEAISDYIRQIKGNKIIFNAVKIDRKEYLVPDSLTSF